MKIQIEAKELKTLIEKVLPIVPKKAQFSFIQTILVDSSKGKLTLSGSDYESFLSVSTTSYSELEGGKMLISLADAKLITKLNGSLTIESQDAVWSDGKYIVHCVIKDGKKKITIETIDIERYLSVPEVDGSNDVVSVNSSSFLKTINKLYPLLLQGSNNMLLTCYNLNISKKRIEAMNTLLAGVNDFEFSSLEDDGSNICKSILLRGSVNGLLKKIVNKTDSELIISTNDKTVFITGNDFVLSQKRVEGKYYDVDRIFGDSGYVPCLNFTINVPSVIKTVNFGIDVKKADGQNKLPLAVCYEKSSSKCYTAIKTPKHTVVDEVDMINSKSVPKDDFLIGVDPVFLSEVLKCIDTDEAEIKFYKPKSPIFIDGKGEKYLVLPWSLGDEATIDSYIK